MKIALINGSPRGKQQSTSGFLLNALKEYLGREKCGGNQESTGSQKVLGKPEYIEAVWNQKPDKKYSYEQFLACDVIILSFPLYVDSVPSHVLSHLIAMESYAHETKLSANCTVYAMVNNGFYDAKQNHLALDVIKNWCSHMSFTFGQGIGFGGGGMLSGLPGVPNDQGPKKNIGEALKRLAIAIPKKECKENEFILPNFPAIGYKLAAQHGWRAAVRKNGMRPKDLRRKLSYSPK